MLGCRPGVTTTEQGREGSSRQDSYGPTGVVLEPRGSGYAFHRPGAAPRFAHPGGEGDVAAQRLASAGSIAALRARDPRRQAADELHRGRAHLVHESQPGPAAK